MHLNGRLPYGAQTDHNVSYILVYRQCGYDDRHCGCCTFRFLGNHYWREKKNCRNVNKLWNRKIVPIFMLHVVCCIFAR